MIEQELNIEQLLQDYARARDAMVDKMTRKQRPDTDKLLAAIREIKQAKVPANRFVISPQSHWVPNTDVFINREHCLVISVELAGMRREDLEITIDGNRIMISGQRPEGERAEYSFLVTEVNYGPFECVIQVPEGYQLYQAKAAYHNGFLRVEVPKAQPVAAPLPPGPNIEKVLQDYVQDRDRAAAKLPLRLEHLSLVRPAIASALMSNASQDPPLQRWWQGVRRSFLSIIGQVPSNSPLDKEFKKPESGQHRGTSDILNRAMTRLAQECTARGKAELFENLKEFLTKEASAAEYSLLARKLQKGPEAVAVMVHRLRRRFSALVREEIAQTVTNPEAIEDELRRLFR
jgi:HSP20 family molecular chaperone IbpA